MPKINNNFIFLLPLLEHGYGSILRGNQRRGTIKVVSTITEDNQDLLVSVEGFLIIRLYRKGLYPPNGVHFFDPSVVRQTKSQT